MKMAPMDSSSVLSNVDLANDAEFAIISTPRQSQHLSLRNPVWEPPSETTLISHVHGSAGSWEQAVSSCGDQLLKYSSSPISEYPLCRDMGLGIESNPIVLDEPSDGHDAPSVGKIGYRSLQSNVNIDYPSSPNQVQDDVTARDILDLTSDEGDSVGALSLPGDSTALFQSSKQQNIEDNEIHLLGMRRAQNGPMSSNLNKDQFARHNLNMAFPHEILKQYSYNAMQLRKDKTVELLDGDFLRIKGIIKNTWTQSITLRGDRLQRVKHLNGMLEKKLNEAVLFVEVDLDDPRRLNNQAAIEVPIAEVLRLRNVRFTNLKFPLARNFDLSHFNSIDKAADQGGLTVRWKYTCTYASATHRHLNTFKERTLERLRQADELLHSKFVVLEKSRRTSWRGETIRGGAYVPIDGQQIDRSWDVLTRLSQPNYERSISISSTSSESNHIITMPGSECSSINRSRSSSMSKQPQYSNRKRKRDSSLGIEADVRRVSLKDYNAIEAPRWRLSNTSIQEAIAEKTAEFRGRLTVLESTSRAPNDHSSLPPTGSIISDSSRQTQTKRLRGQKYTYGDAFCGAGGSTRGAVMAGLHVKWGFDSDSHACDTWKQNFENQPPYAKCFHMDAEKFVKLALNDASILGDPNAMKVDILHLSPPCQFFSPAHTVNGIHDETNVASLFAVQSVIGVSKARVVTLEQTFGLASPRFRFYFNSLIQMFTAHDFSVRWAIVPLAQWGLPQRRLRLIMIASCPGEKLPCMPPATHSEGGTGGLKPFVSVSETLASVRPNADNHDLEFVDAKNQLPYDGSKILPRAMTTHGGQNYHPSGKRDFTMAEYAALQGFPEVHTFKKTSIKRQIGNAVPPCVAKVLFESIKRDLESADSIEDEPELLE